MWLVLVVQEIPIKSLFLKSAVQVCRISLTICQQGLRYRFQIECESPILNALGVDNIVVHTVGGGGGGGGKLYMY